MTLHQITDLQTPIGKIVENLGPAGAWVETPNHAQFVIVPLGDDLIDHFVETNPAFIAECRAIRARMRGGQTVSLDDAKRMLADKSV
jgi:hypothetical protein